MDQIKCKHCCSVISLLGNLWYDQGRLLRDICFSSPTLLHEPETIEVSDQKEEKNGS